MSLLLASLLFGSSVVLADGSLDRTVGTAHRWRDILKDQYPSTVRSAMRSGVAQHYLALQYDHVTFKNILRAKVDEGFDRLKNLERQFEDLSQSLGTNRDNRDETLVEALSKIGVAKDSVVTARALIHDLDSIRESWKSACAPASLDYVTSLSNPLSYRSLIELGEVHPANAIADLSFEVQASTDLSAEGSHVRASPTMAHNDTDKAIIGTGVALYASPTPFGKIAGVVILVGWALVKTGIYSEEVRHVASKQSDLLKYLRDIRRIQLDALVEVGLEVRPTVAASCAQFFPPEAANEFVDDTFKKFHDEASSVVSRLAQRRQSLLREYSERLADLNEIYLPSVRKTFMANVIDRYGDSKRRSHDVEDQFLRRFAKPLERLKVSPGISRWRIKDEIWTELILADGTLRHESGFGFLPKPEASEGAKGFEDIWSGMSRKLMEKLR